MKVVSCDKLTKLSGTFNMTNLQKEGEKEFLMRDTLCLPQLYGLKTAGSGAWIATYFFHFPADQSAYYQSCKGQNVVVSSKAAGMKTASTKGFIFHFDHL